jgi:hypothetical protein
MYRVGFYPVASPVQARHLVAGHLLVLPMGVAGNLLVLPMGVAGRHQPAAVAMGLLVQGVVGNLVSVFAVVLMAVVADRRLERHLVQAVVAVVLVQAMVQAGDLVLVVVVVVVVVVLVLLAVL